MPYKIYYQTPESSDDRALVAANFVLEETSKDARVRNAGKGLPAPYRTNKYHIIKPIARFYPSPNKTNYSTKENCDDREAVVANFYDARVRNAGKEGLPAPWGTNKNHTCIKSLAHSIASPLLL